MGIGSYLDAEELDELECMKMGRFSSSLSFSELSSVEEGKTQEKGSLNHQGSLHAS